MSRLTRLAAALLLAVLPSAVATAAGAGAPQKPPEQMKTVGDLRNVGTAMWQWYKVAQAPHRSESAHKAAEAAAQGPQDITDVPVISRQDLAKLLVPTYIDAIPEKDGWGNAYEYHLNTKAPGGTASSPATSTRLAASRLPKPTRTSSGSTATSCTGRRLPRRENDPNPAPGAHPGARSLTAVLRSFVLDSGVTSLPADAPPREGKSFSLLPTVCLRRERLFPFFR
jgi:hypothetical protein